MSKLFLVGIGGCLGSVLRYVVGSYVQQLSVSGKFPLGTFAVNIIGCLLIGVVSQLAEGRNTINDDLKAFIVIGVLGGFTTFSSFGNETIELWRTEKQLLALLNVAGHMVLCLAAVCLGRAVVLFLRGR